MRKFPWDRKHTNEENPTEPKVDLEIWWNKQNIFKAAEYDWVESDFFGINPRGNDTPGYVYCYYNSEDSKSYEADSRMPFKIGLTVNEPSRRI